MSAMAALPGLEDVSASDLSFVLAFLRDNSFAAAEGELMAELERRILSAAPQPNDDAPSAPEAPALEEQPEWCA